MRSLAMSAKKKSKKPVREDEIIRYAQNLKNSGFDNETIDRSLDKKFGGTWQGYRAVEELREKVAKADKSSEPRPAGLPSGLPPGREPVEESAAPIKKVLPPILKTPVEPEPVSPVEASLVPQETGYAPSGTSPGNVKSELTPNPWLPAFVPNYQGFYNPWLSMLSQPSYTDPNWFLRAESPYPQGMQYTQPTNWQTPVQNYGMSGFYQQPFGMGLGYSAGNLFSQQGSIGGGMLGNMGKGLNTVPLGGMLGQRYS
jgi:hypothetical protein